jgi:hypothetical protein
MIFKPFCDNQIHTKENPENYDCLALQLEGHNCICPYTPQNIHCLDGQRVRIGKPSGNDLTNECLDFEAHSEFLGRIGQPPYETENLRNFADTSE